MNEVDWGRRGREENSLVFWRMDGRVGGDLKRGLGERGERGRLDDWIGLDCGCRM